MNTYNRLKQLGIDMSWYDKVKTPNKQPEQITQSNVHRHTLQRVYKRTRIDSGPRFILSWKCTTCPFKQAYDLVADEPKKEGGA